MHGKQLTFRSTEAAWKIKGRNAELNEARLSENFERRPILPVNLFGARRILLSFIFLVTCMTSLKLRKVIFNCHY